MYVEISKEDEAPDNHLLSNSEVILGSGQVSDIRIDEPSVSKKHLKIIEEKGVWYVVDQGSTNGTYKDGERLIPGKKTEVGVGDYLRLGGIVFVRIIEKAGAAPKTPRPQSVHIEPMKEEDKTRVMSLDELKKDNADKKKKNTPQKKAKKKRAKPQVSTYIALTILVGGYLLNRSCTKPAEDKTTIIETMNNNSDAAIKKVEEASE